MKFIIIGKNIDVTPGLREAVESKLGKLERYFTPNTEIHVTLSIDLVEEVIERQLRKYKNKLVAREQEGGNFKQEFFEEDDKIEDAGEIKIVRTKKFGFKPMYPEDACVQMELLGHNFFVFSNAETDEVNVVYKRKDGSFGLIEPEFS